MREMLLVDAAKQTQEVTQSRPEAFHRVGMYFAYLVAVFIPRPFPLAGLMTDLLQRAPVFRQVIVSLLLVGMDGHCPKCHGP